MAENGDIGVKKKIEKVSGEDEISAIEMAQKRRKWPAMKARRKASK
jgi:hypothetical protein